MKPVPEYADLHNMIGPCMFDWLSLEVPWWIVSGHICTWVS